MEPTTIVPAAPAAVEDLPIVAEARDQLDQACMAAEDRLDIANHDAAHRARSLRDVVDAFDDYLGHLNEHAATIGPAAALAATSAALAVLALIGLEQDAEANA